MIPRRPRTISTIDGEFDLNDYDVVATLPDQTQVRIASPEDLDALTDREGDVPLLINPRAVAPGVVPAPVAPIFTYSGSPETEGSEPGGLEPGGSETGGSVSG